MGNPGFPIPPPGGKVWEGTALTQGHGEPGFPHSSARGRAWEGQALDRVRSGTGALWFHPPQRRVTTASSRC